MSTIADIVPTYRSFHRDLDDSTLRQHEIVAGLVVKCFGPQADWHELFDATNLTRFQSWLLDTNWGGKRRTRGTVNVKIGTVLAWWQTLHDRQVIAIAPPPRQWYRLTVARDLPSAWSDEQFAAILKNMKAFPQRPEWNKEHMTCLCLAIWYTGARIEGLLACDLSNIIFDDRLLLPAEFQKTNRGQAHKLPQWLVKRIRRLPRAAGDTRLIPTPFSRVATLRTHLRRCVVAAGFRCSNKDLFHKFRRSSATLVCAAQGIEEARRHLGHTTQEMTRGYIDPTHLPTTSAADYFRNPLEL